jgi:MFS family permease
MLQGVAVGGEYGGAVVYVAEHATRGRRGASTSWIQVTGTAGFIVSLVVILITRLALGKAAFAAWGWRLPFLFSILLLGVSVWIRMSLEESSIFAQMKSEGTLSKAPVCQAFGNWKNIKVVLASLFGLIAGFGVVWYTAQFYTLLFPTQTLMVDAVTANIKLSLLLCCLRCRSS